MSTGEGRGLWRLFVLAATLVACLLIPAAASAATRYAASGGTATPADCTTPEDPCSIFTAAQGTGVVAGDEAVIAPGNYSDTAGDLGPNDYVDPVANTVHGATGEPRPVITLEEHGNGGFGAFKVDAGNTISHIQIDTMAAETNINLTGGVVDDLIAHSGTDSGPIVCKFTGSATLRDSACISTGAQARTVGSFFTGTGTYSAILRNVTAIGNGASDSNSNAVDFAATDTVTLNLDAKSVLASGATFDLYGEEFGSASVAIAISNSNYSSYGTQGTPTLTGANNQTAEPALASDSIHQLANSPTVNAGADTTGDSTFGSADIDGQSRKIGSAPDIGADELANPTSTQVICNPNPTLVGAWTTCTATVIDTAMTGAGVPQGTVEFSSDTGGAFDPGPSCILALVGENGSSCQVTYIPGAIGTGTHQVSAAFPGDTSRDASNGSTDLGVTKHPSATSISCAPESIALGAGTSTCAVTVTDTSSGPSTPTGSVALSSASGAFGSGCEELALVSTSQALCTVTYTPSGTGMNLLTADYGGDPTHATSEGTAAVNVAAPPSAAGPSSSPALKKKCRKKKRSASAAKKKKCKKKKRR